METGKKEITRRTIMRAARGVFEEKGIENTSFRDIAQAAGVSRSTVFNYFAGSAELLTALCGQEIDDLEKAYAARRKTGKPELSASSIPSSTIPPNTRDL